MRKVSIERDPITTRNQPSKKKANETVKRLKTKKICPPHPKLNNSNRYIHKSMYILNTLVKCYVCLISMPYFYTSKMAAAFLL